MKKRLYKESGVDVDRDNKLSSNALHSASSTFNNSIEKINSHILSWPEIKSTKNPRILKSADGVGTKSMYAIPANNHFVLGWDLVAMNVNDLARNNAVPFTFLDYIGKGPRVTKEIIAELLAGMIAACKESGCALVGGEIASMPLEGDVTYELAGFADGVVDKKSFIDGSLIREGDVLFALPSSGIHCNGYSAVRKLFPPKKALQDKKFLSLILQPTRIYVKPVLELNRKFQVHGWAHITGTGIIGKLGDIIPDGLQAKVDWNSWIVPEIFRKIQNKGNISDYEMRKTFNMGFGMIGVVSPKTVEKVLSFLKRKKEKVFLIGGIRKSVQTTKKVI